MHPTQGAEEVIEREEHPAPGAGRWRVQGLVVSLGLLLVAGCNRPEPVSGESPGVTAAKAAVARKLSAPASAEYRHILEYSDGVVCGEVNARKMYSGTDIGYRKFIYNAPEAGALVMENAELTRQEIHYWCSEQPDKRLRMLTASVAELDQACKAKGAKASATSCRLAATQKRSLEELQAATIQKGPQPGPLPAGQAGATGPVAAVPAVATPALAVPAVAASAPVATTAAATTEAAPTAAAPTAAASAATPPQPANAGNDEAAIVAEVGNALQTWRERWQDGDVDGYLRTYAPSFTGGAASRGEWEQQRRQKMTNARPSIRVEKLEAARITPQEVELRFVQVYSARRHRDRGHKTMVFQRTPQGWLIVDERWVKAS